jgi:hypothetical protein
MMLAARDKLAALQPGAAGTVKSAVSAHTTAPVLNASGGGGTRTSSAFAVPGTAVGADFADTDARGDDDNDDDYDPNALYATAAALLPHVPPTVSVNPVSLLPRMRACLRSRCCCRTEDFFCVSRAQLMRRSCCVRFSSNH